jgi:hypothetical protein
MYLDILLITFVNIIKMLKISAFYPAAISTSTNFTTKPIIENSTSTDLIPITIKIVQVEIVLVETVLVVEPLYVFLLASLQ